MKIEFFWHPRKKDSFISPWSMRGIAFHHRSRRKNVHYRSLLFLFGATNKLKLKLGLRAWKTLLTLGYK